MRGSRHTWIFWGGMTGCLLLWAGLAAAEGGGASNLAEALRQGEADVSVYQNALYLYLRLAGAVWIVVEWVAAVVLWRAFVVLRRSVRQERSGP